MTAGSLALLGIVVAAWCLVAGRAARANVSAAMALVAAGLVLANGPLAVARFDLTSETARLLAEVTLALVLFGDAARVDLRRLRADAGFPTRLLVLGLPLTILMGALAGAVLLRGAGIWLAALVAAIVAPTDAALGAPILLDRRIPERVRRTLNVESGLNDGIATPFVNLFLAGVLAEGAAHGHQVSHAVEHLVVGTVVGIVVGLVGGWLLQQATRRDWADAASRPLVAVALAGAAYAGALVIEGNGFVAAFVAGLAFGAVIPEADEEPLLAFTEEFGRLLSYAVWFLFGALLVVPAVRAATPGDVVFALVALTVVRMVPVAIALIGSGLDRSTVALVGWFGPRGLASVVFTLLAFEDLRGSDAEHVVAAASLTVLFSVVAHGITASPFADRYARRSAGTPALEAHPT